MNLLWKRDNLKGDSLCYELLILGEDSSSSTETSSSYYDYVQEPNFRIRR